MAHGVLGEGDHYELFLNPYTGSDGRHRVLVTRRRDGPEPAGLPPDKLERHPLTEFESSLPITGVVLRFLARHLPSLMVRRFDSVLAGMVDDGYANVSYKVFNIGEANHLPAYILAATSQGSMPLLYTGQEASMKKRLRFFEKDTVDWSKINQPVSPDQFASLHQRPAPTCRAASCSCRTFTPAPTQPTVCRCEL